MRSTFWSCLTFSILYRIGIFGSRATDLLVSYDRRVACDWNALVTENIVFAWLIGSASSVCFLTMSLAGWAVSTRVLVGERDIYFWNFSLKVPG